ncbi:hypothetical protein Pint_14318 [Pistacia integerrima]|uniref:Uncharacterized protein n=1 Tax=Pistacia integerrima TaxID=434235 RepID=A0ACC0Y4D8_9ROSI|nr:hypothetical protein Pint_14318 [Pistacia integerrima]
MNYTVTVPKGSILIKKKSSEALWDANEIRTLLLLSIGAQAVLTFFGNRRKYRLSSLSRFCVWLSYLMASPMVTFVLGRLSTMSTTTYVVKENDAVDIDKYSNYKFYMDWWASMLLVQICSPNMISYSIEDNKLTFRQVIGLSTQVALAVWIFCQALIYMTGTVITEVTEFILEVSGCAPGLIKVVERLRAFMSLRNREKVVITTFVHSDSRKVEIPIELRSNFRETSDDLALLVKAYQRFDRLKPYLENWLGYHSSSYLPNSVSVDYGHPKDVFRVTEFELSFMYDVLYTNAFIRYSKRSFLGRIICIIILSVLCVRLGYEIDNDLDFIITYVLLIGALVLEFYEMKEFLCSDWAILNMMNQNRSACMRRLLRIVARKNPSKKHRWSHSMDQFNLLSYCLYEDSTKLGGLIRRIPKVKSYYSEYKKCCVKKDIKVPEELKKLVLQQVEEVRAQRGGNPFSECGVWPLEKCYCLQDLELNIPQDFGSHAKKQTKKNQGMKPHCAGFY